LRPRIKDSKKSVEKMIKKICTPNVPNTKARIVLLRDPSVNAVHDPNAES